MQFLKEKEKSRNKIENISILKYNNYKSFWIFKISLISFFISFLLSVCSELFLSHSNIFLATILLLIFMSLNIFSDMLGLAITSCQVAQIKETEKSKKIIKVCLSLINNSDKVSSILCDVVGDICAILCGVCGSVIAIIISNKLFLGSFIFLFGAFVSSIIASFTVLFKAISKNYAVKNSIKIVNRTAKFIIKIQKIFKKEEKGF